MINDHNDILINFYLAAQNSFPELQERIRNTLHSESMYYYAKDVWNGRCEASDIEKAWAVWMITNGSFAGSMHGGWKWCNGRSGSQSAVMLKNKRIDFSEQLRDRLDQVQISCRDALRVIKDRDSEDTFFYLDPPYPSCVQQHYSGYTHSNFYDLLSLLATIKGKFILSNYWCQTFRCFVLKYGWNVKSVEVDLKVNQQGKGHKVEKRTEILAYNYDIEKTLFH